LNWKLHGDGDGDDDGDGGDDDDDDADGDDDADADDDGDVREDYDPVIITIIHPIMFNHLFNVTARQLFKRPDEIFTPLHLLNTRKR